MRVKQGAVNVDDDLVGRGAGCPGLRSCGGPGRGDVAQAVAVDRVQHPPHRRVRPDGAEQFRLLTQRSDVGQTITAVGEHHRQMRQHDTRIMRRAAPPSVRHRRRQTRGEPDPVGQFGQQQRPGMRAHTLAVASHLDPLRSAVPFTFEVPSRSAT